jgi:hypothetical protein
MSGGHQRNLLALRVAALGTLEICSHRRRAAERLPRSLGNQSTDDRRAFARDVPEPILVTGLVLTRNEPEVPADRFGIAKAMGIINEAATASAVRIPTPGMLRNWATADDCCAWRFNCCSIRRT